MDPTLADDCSGLRNLVFFSVAPSIGSAGRAGDDAAGAGGRDRDPGRIDLGPAARLGPGRARSLWSVHRLLPRRRTGLLESAFARRPSGQLAGVALHAVRG